MEEYKIGDQFYLHISSSGNNNESINLVTLESIKPRKVRGKDEYYNTYTFKYLNGDMESEFTDKSSKFNTAIFQKTKNISIYHSIHFYIYKLDDESILNMREKLKNKIEKYEGIKVLEEFISELKKSDSFENLSKLNAVVKVVKHYG